MQLLACARMLPFVFPRYHHNFFVSADNATLLKYSQSICDIFLSYSLYFWCYLSSFVMSFLVVENLSFFCEESHLFNLFDQYADVQLIKIVKDGSGCPRFAHITITSENYAVEMQRILNNHLFMGRRLR